MTTRLAALSSERMHLQLMLALTFTTGIVDAVGYLGLDRVFTGNMTGNVVILGMAVVGAEDLPILGPLLALVGFMLGAALAGRTLRGIAGAWSARTTGLLAGVAGITLGLAALLFVVGDEPSRVVGISVTTLLGGAMGVQAATARLIGVKEVTTVVVTSTITGLAADSALAGGSHPHTGRRILAVLMILLGAMVGAALLRWELGAGLVLAGLIMVVVTVLGSIHARGQLPAQ